jgi:hypothetical protein
MVQGSPSADGFCKIEFEDGSEALELHQNKHIQGDLNKKRFFLEEFEKANPEKKKKEFIYFIYDW